MIRLKKCLIAKMCFILLVYYKVLPWIFSKMERTPHEEVNNFIMNITGCHIPNYIKGLKFIEPQHKGLTCGRRLMHFEGVSDHEVRFRADHELSKQMGSNNSQLKCGYVGVKSLDSNLEGVLSRIVPIIDGQIVRIFDEASIFVICSTVHPAQLRYVERDLPQPVFIDYHVILKKDTQLNEKPNENTRDPYKKWNVLLLGMENMSRARVEKSMPELLHHFKKEGWLDYRALHKVSKNNSIMFLLTGNKACSNPFMCRELHLFYKYRQSGYVTAIGEDSTVTRDSLTAKMAAFKLTDHYLNILLNIEQGNYKCFGQISAGEQMLDYAFQFASSYEKENFFGMFLSSSFSHIDSKGIPALFQNSLINFFRQLNSKGILQHTFILFFGYEDSIYGSSTFSKEAYYNIRLPALFMWVPLQFRRLHRDNYNNLILNQNRLTIHKDVYTFLEDILKDRDQNAVVYANPAYVSLLDEISPERTCNDANVEESLCACYNMTDASKDEGSKDSLFVTVSEIARRLSSARFRYPFSKCIELNFKEVLRSHSYKHGGKIYYVTAGMFELGDIVFESIVERSGDSYRLVSLQSLTEYIEKSSCMRIDDPAREFCACEYMMPDRPSLPSYNITSNNTIKIQLR